MSLPRPKLSWAVVTALLAVLALTSHSPAGAHSSRARSAQVLVDGRTLYRQYCGKCHALKEALAAGFGSAANDGLGKYGGPSFNELRVPYTYSIWAVTEPTGGHELVRHKIAAKQLNKVALWLATVTRHHPIPALPTDG